MSYSTKVYVEQGGEIDIESGGALKIAGTDKTAALAAAVSGAAAGYMIARGETALDGSNPTTVATGLTTVVAFVATIKKATSPGTTLSTLTANIGSGGAVDVYAWKPTSASDTTLVASTATDSFYWVAVGT